MTALLPDVHHLSVRPSAQEIRRCSLWLADHCRQASVPDEPAGKLDLCLNEVLANLLEHGGAADHGIPVDLTLELTVGAEGGRAALTISDAGPAFDPLGVERDPLPHSLREARPGGLGLLLVHRFMDERSYHRTSDRNVLKLGIHWSKDA